MKESNETHHRKLPAAGRLIDAALVLVIIGALIVLLKSYGNKHQPGPAALALAQPTATATRQSALTKLGRHQAVIFSPDFAAPGNRRFYEALGFQYDESADWAEILDGLKQYNRAHPDEPLQRIFLQTHGSNGNGLKLQQSASRTAPRSYISLGALQEQLDGSGISRLVLTACNTGRLFRPEIYNTLKLPPHDPTVLPATRGIINASPDFDPARSRVELVRRTDSRIEQTSEGHYRELPEAVRRALALPASNDRFVVSNLMMQMLINDPQLQLTSEGYVNTLSRHTESAKTSEAMFQSFLRFLAQRADPGIPASVRAE
ncbi:MAG: hypothetical protein U0Z53_06965 [Blastocatellia bacterium]